MIKANHTHLGMLFFRFYSKFRLHRHFKNIFFDGTFDDSGKPVLIIGNHFSWWDGFIQNYLNQLVFKRKFHVMMLEEQLEQNMILNRTGAFSIKKNDRSIIESLNYCTELLQEPKNMVLIFPQGEIQSVYTHDLVFQRGLEYVFKRLKGNFQLVFNVNLIDYFSDNRPSLTVCYKKYDLTTETDVAEVEQEFNNYAHDCMKKQLPR